MSSKTVKHYLATTIHILVEVEEDFCGIDLDATACDGLADTLRAQYPFIKDWAYVKNDKIPFASRWVELPLNEGTIQEGDFLQFEKSLDKTII